MYLGAINPTNNNKNIIIDNPKYDPFAALNAKVFEVYFNGSLFPIVLNLYFISFIVYFDCDISIYNFAIIPSIVKSYLTLNFNLLFSIYIKFTANFKLEPSAIYSCI